MYLKSKKHIENAKIALLKAADKIQENKKERETEYLLNPKLCIHCNSIIEYSKKDNKFCSKSCSASYNNEKRTVKIEQKEKVKNSLKDYYKKTGKKPGSQSIKKEFKRVCPLCNELFTVKRINGKLSRAKYCSDICSNTAMKMNVSESQKELVKKGLHQGWKSRKIISYPEKFFMGILENMNISYQHNFMINKKDLGVNDLGNYFLDFYLEEKKIDLEIDGKQHSYKDRKKNDALRDEILRKNGFQVYRIKWKCINNDKGKKYIQQEIVNFLNFAGIV